MTENVGFVVFLKNLSYVGAFLAGIEWLGFNPQTLLLLGILMGIDIVTALFRVSKNEGGSAIKSSAFREGLTSKFLLFSGLFAIAITTKGVGFDLRLFAQGTISVIMLFELYSILGNIHSWRTGKPKVEFDVMSVLLRKLRDLIDSAVK
jgi:hypothetical protein